MATQTALNAELSASARALAANAASDEAEQMSFLPEVVSISTADSAAVAANGVEERKRGRPKGSENLSSAQLRELVVRAGGHPVLAMARWAGMTPEEMAIRLGISKAEAFDRLVALWDKITPYVAARLAPVDDKGKAVVPILMQFGMQGEARADGAFPWSRAFEVVDGEVVENQGLSAANDEKSHAEKSYGA